jgi:hypothetical protein
VLELLASIASAVEKFIMFVPSVVIPMVAVPESVTVTFELPCDIELVDIVVKLRLPDPSVFITCPADPSVVG